jgi:hypothetical protein
MRSGTPDEILAKGRYVAASEQPLSFREKSVDGAFPRFVPAIVMLHWIAVVSDFTGPRSGLCGVVASNPQRPEAS